MSKGTNTDLRVRKVQDDTNDRSVIPRTKDGPVQGMSWNTELVILKSTKLGERLHTRIQRAEETYHRYRKEERERETWNSRTKYLGYTRA